MIKSLFRSKSLRTFFKKLFCRHQWFDSGMVFLDPKHTYWAYSKTCGKCWIKKYEGRYKD